jgi:glucose/arabinose dehydrogenase
MLHFISLRLALSAILAAVFLPAMVHAQSQDFQSVAEAARRSREQKKAQAKPARVITEDDVKPAIPADTAPSPAGVTNAPAATAPAAPTPAGSSTTPDSKDEKAPKESKEVTALKDQIKQVQNDLDLLQREQSLEQDSYFSNPDYVHNTAGKAKLDALKQQVSDKQQELDGLKARLAELQASQASSTTTPRKP